MASPSSTREQGLEISNLQLHNVVEASYNTSVLKDARLGKKALGLGKKHSGNEGTKDTGGNTGQPAPSASTIGISPSFENQFYQSPSSPLRTYFSSSPRISSPAESSIFERDVSTVIPLSSDQIPPVLDASSEIITNATLDPDNVEIITAHQPTSVTITGAVSMDQSWTSSWDDELISNPDKDDLASSYGALDSTDVRRLSFISFADIVQSEHHVGSRDSFHVAGLSSLPSGRSPSPMRSPVSSQGFNNSPPTSNSASIHGFENISHGNALGSPTASHHGGDLTVETMSQALRRTTSGELSGHRSQPLSPSLSEELFELQ